MQLVSFPFHRLFSPVEVNVCRFVSWHHYFRQ